MVPQLFPSLSPPSHFSLLTSPTFSRRQDELEAKLIEEETQKRVEELVAKRVAEELERRKDEIEAEVLRRVEEAKKVETGAGRGGEGDRGSAC